MFSPQSPDVCWDPHTYVRARYTDCSPFSPLLRALGACCRPRYLLPPPVQALHLIGAPRTFQDPKFACHHYQHGVARLLPSVTRCGGSTKLWKVLRMRIGIEANRTQGCASAHAFRWMSAPLLFTRARSASAASRAALALLACCCSSCAVTQALLMGPQLLLHCGCH